MVQSRSSSYPKKMNVQISFCCLDSFILQLAAVFLSSVTPIAIPVVPNRNLAAAPRQSIALEQWNQFHGIRLFVEGAAANQTCSRFVFWLHYAGQLTFLALSGSLFAKVRAVCFFFRTSQWSWSMLILLNFQAASAASSKRIPKLWYNGCKGPLTLGLADFATTRDMEDSGPAHLREPGLTRTNCPPKNRDESFFPHKMQWVMTTALCIW